MHKTTTHFWKCFNNLPHSVQKIAKRNFNLLKTDPLHPSLRFKKIGKFWSIRIGIKYRALAVKEGKYFIWVWIGNHDDYEQMLKKEE